MKYVFYYLQNYGEEEKKDIDLAKHYHYQIWSPGLFELFPKGNFDSKSGLVKSKFNKTILCWRFLYYLILNHVFSIFIIYRNNNIVHYTVILSKSVKFPFMGKYDIQFGPVWTHPNERKKGLMKFALYSYIKISNKKDRKYWWVCRENNNVSRIAIEKKGFNLYGIGTKKSILPLGVLGRFTIEEIKNKQ
jgi:hypothetical protein